MPKQEEYAELVVNGQRFRDWTSVTVRKQFGQADEFVFTLSEDRKAPVGTTDWANWRIRPGDACTIYLGGVLAVTGYVNVRRSSYDANQHVVIIQGRHKDQDMVDSSVTNIKGGQLKGYNLDAIGRTIAKPFGISFSVDAPSAIAAIANLPFRDFSIQPGETAWGALTRAASMRGLWLQSLASGDVKATALDPGVTSIGRLEEGVNIVSASAMIRDDSAFSTIQMIAQVQGTKDEYRGEKTRTLSATAQNSNVTRYRPYRGVAEHPMTSQELKRRADYEAAVNGGEIIEATVTVQGWLKTGNSLWDVAEVIHLNSWMLALDLDLGIRALAFTQEAGGTRTTFELVRKETLSGTPALGSVTPHDPSTVMGGQVGGQTGPAQIDPPDWQQMEQSGRGV